MARASLLFLLLFFVIQGHAHPLSFFHKLSATSQEGGWLWGWVWGAESSVSVVDRSPPLNFHSRPAAFGRELRDQLLGYVIPLSSFTTSCPSNDTSLVDHHSNSGCPKLCISGPHQPDPSESWIALVQRGHCSFVDKVRESQRLGARAVVIGGQDPDVSGQADVLVNMYSTGDASDVKISSTYIKWSDYKELSLLINSSTTSHAGLRTLSLSITSQYSAWEWYSPILTFIVILILPSCLTFITLLIHRIRMARAAQRDRAPENIVKSFPWRVWNGTAWEKHEGTTIHGAHSNGAHDSDLESGPSYHSTSSPSTSHEALIHAPIPWCEFCYSNSRKKQFLVAEELSSSAGFVTEALSCSIFETRGRFSIMTEAPLRKSDSQPEALPDSVNVREPKRFHGEERDRFLHVLQIAKTLADDDDEEFAPSEELVNQVMKSLEEEIASNCCTYYPSSCTGDKFAGPDISCGNQGQTQYSDSSVDLLYLLEASDDDLGIPPNLVLEVKDEVHLSTKETSQGFSENTDIKSGF